MSAVVDSLIALVKIFAVVDGYAVGEFVILVFVLSIAPIFVIFTSIANNTLFDNEPRELSPNQQLSKIENWLSAILYY